MPIAATPLEQLVVAVAVKRTGEPSVLPLAGDVTATPADAHTDSVSKQSKVFIDTPALLVLARLLAAQELVQWNYTLLLRQPEQD
jgi:hypothetical protein